MLACGRFLLLLLLAHCAATVAHADEAVLRLGDGDRVVLVGNTLIERAQRYGFWETALTAASPRADVVFRNLGWSGDNVQGQARARFGTARDGFKHLRDHVEALRPTVILVGYGANAAFGGEEGLDDFRRGLDDMLDMLASSGARIILIGPPMQEDLGRPLPDPTEHNRNLQTYINVLRQTAEERDYPLVDLYALLAGDKEKPPQRFTDNGIHLSAYGYWRSASVLQQALIAGGLSWNLSIDATAADAVATEAAGVEVAGLQTTPEGVRFSTLDARLPLPPRPKRKPATEASESGLPARKLSIAGLKPGRYQLLIDQRKIAAAAAEQWADGLALGQGPEFDQAEELRQTIIAKNRLYFYRWRPQNETYLFGFRKHEQGQNAAEIVKFDPLIENQEAVIRRLRTPIRRYYELILLPN